MPYIQYPDVNAPGELPVLDMDASDDIASMIPSLAVNVAFRKVINNGTGNLVTRNRKGGSPIVKIGTLDGFSVVNSPAFNNSPALRVTGNGLVFRTDPSTVPSASYCIVLPISFSQAAIDNTVGASQIISRANDSTLKMSMRRTGGSLIFTPDQATAATAWTKPMTDFVADTPYIFVVEWNDQKKDFRIFINDMDNPILISNRPTYASNISAGDTYFLFAGGTSNIGTVWGDYPVLNIFNKTMTDDHMGNIQLRTLITSMKTLYGIA
jgi:hypothetical protein